MSLRILVASLVAWLFAGCGGEEPTQPVAAAPAAADAGDSPEDDGFVGCPASIPKFALGLQASGDKGRITASLIAASNLPPLRYLNDWTLAFSAGGLPLADITVINARSFMPVHGHDGIVKPVIEPLASAGQLRVRGLNFNMRGPWEVQLMLSSPSLGDDYVVFHICIEE